MLVSVLMSVYHRVNPADLKLCLNSLAWQTRPADEIVIAIDGPIPDPLRGELDHFASASKIQVKFVELAENLGLTGALNAAIPHCSGDWLMRMDADDIALPERFAKQLSYLEAHPETDLVGTSLFEFETEPTKPQRLKPALESHEQIRSSIVLRNPINHPTVCVRKQCLLDVGGYPEMPLLEDYYLWAKLLGNGARFHNLTEALYLFRFDDGTLERRAGSANFRNEVWLRRWMKQEGLTTLFPMLGAILLQLILRFAPRGLRRWLWRRSRKTVTAELNLPL